MLYLLAFIGLGVCLIYIGKALKKIGAFFDLVSEDLAEKRIQSQYKPRKTPKHRDSYLDTVRDEINYMTDQGDPK